MLDPFGLKPDFVVNVPINSGRQGILLRGEVFFIEVDAKALNPLKTTSIHNAARMVESCATNPIRGGPVRKPT